MGRLSSVVLLLSTCFVCWGGGGGGGGVCFYSWNAKRGEASSG